MKESFQNKKEIDESKETLTGKGVVVLASGYGSNFESLLTNPEVKKEVLALFSNNKDSRALEVAEKFDIKHTHVKYTKRDEQADFETSVGDEVEKLNPKLIVLAGFMRILSPLFVKRFKGKIIKIHPSLLPKYPGMNSIERALENKDSKTGVTIHFVDEGVDTGKIIDQVEVDIDPRDTLDTLTTKVQKAEHKLLNKVVSNLIKE